MRKRKKDKEITWRHPIKRFRINRRIRRVEREWTGLEIEQGAIIDSKTGRVLQRGLSMGKFAVLFLFGQKYMKDNIVTHRHPGEATSFSFADMRTAIFSGARRMRVACDSCVYQMGMPEISAETPKEELKKRQALYKKMKKEYREAGFPTSILLALIKLSIRLIIHGKEAVGQRRSERIKALEEFWRRFALETQGFEFKKLRAWW